MRHADKRFKLNRFTSWNKATLNSLARNMIIHQAITTTLVRAKASRPLIERLISLAKKNTLTAKRRAFQVLGSHKLVSKLFNDIGPLFDKRPSGFTRIILLKRRRGDNAQLVLFELTERKTKEPKKQKKIKEVTVEPNTEETKAQQPREKIEEPKKPTKKFLGGIKKIFKKKRDSL
ncbi:MAG: 50S ribosomal protein L17 [Candidatus Omnitrophota bacterium]